MLLPSPILARPMCQRPMRQEPISNAGNGSWSRGRLDHNGGPRMRQLVGSTCVRCGKRIGSIVEGGFCPECRAPVHFKCAQDTRPAPGLEHCPGCGAKTQAILADLSQERERVARIEDESARNERVRRLSQGVAWLVGGIWFSLFCSGVALGAGRYVIATGAIGWGLGQIALGLFGGRRRKPS
jgi:hypothetical protein